MHLLLVAMLLATSSDALVTTFPWSLEPNAPTAGLQRLTPVSRVWKVSEAVEYFQLREQSMNAARPQVEANSAGEMDETTLLQLEGHRVMTICHNLPIHIL